MTKGEIIETIAKQRMVEQIVSNIAKKDDDTLKDLCQQIYVDLLQKEEEKIVQLYENGQLRFFIVRMVSNNIFSCNSPYYALFKRYSSKASNIDDFIGMI